MFDKVKERVKELDGTFGLMDIDGARLITIILPNVPPIRRGWKPINHLADEVMEKELMNDIDDCLNTKKL